MAKLYLTIIQAVLLYGSESWTVSERKMNKLHSFHKRAIRHMTGKHIQKNGEDEWEYPNHESLLKKCKMFPINIYIERRRGTLRRYMEQYRSELLSEVETSGRHYQEVNKVVWWKQPFLHKPDLCRLSKCWFV